MAVTSNRSHMVNLLSFLHRLPHNSRLWSVPLAIGLYLVAFPAQAGTKSTTPESNPQAEPAVHRTTTPTESPGLKTKREFFSPQARKALRRRELEIGLGVPLIITGLTATGWSVVLAATALPGTGITSAIVSASASGIGTWLLIRGARGRRQLWSELESGRSDQGYFSAVQARSFRRASALLGVGLGLGISGAGLLAWGLPELSFGYRTVGVVVTSTAGALFVGGSLAAFFGARGRVRTRRRLGDDQRVALSLPSILPKRGGLNLSWSGRF